MVSLPMKAIYVGLPVTVLAAMAMVLVPKPHHLQRQSFNTATNASSLPGLSIPATPTVSVSLDGKPVEIKPNHSQQTTKDGATTTVSNATAPNVSSTVVTSTKSVPAGLLNVSVSSNQSNSSTMVQTFQTNVGGSFESSNESTSVFSTGDGIVTVSH